MTAEPWLNSIWKLSLIMLSTVCCSGLISRVMKKKKDLNLFELNWFDVTWGMRVVIMLWESSLRKITRRKVIWKWWCELWNMKYGIDSCKSGLGWVGLSWVRRRRRRRRCCCTERGRGRERWVEEVEDEWMNEWMNESVCERMEVLLFIEVVRYGLVLESKWMDEVQGSEGGIERMYRESKRGLHLKRWWSQGGVTDWLRGLWRLKWCLCRAGREGFAW